MELRRFALYVIVAYLSWANFANAEVKEDQVPRRLTLQSKETSPADFIRLVIMRLIFGLASALGYGESLSNFLGGALVPPGADYEDDYDFVPDLF